MRQAKFVFGGLVMAIAVSIQSLVAPIATATPQEPDWMNGSVGYELLGADSPSQNRCVLENRTITAVGMRVYDASDQNTTRQVCVFKNKGFQYARYQRAYFIDSGVLGGVVLYEKGVAFADGDKKAMTPSKLDGENLDRLYTGDQSSAFILQERNRNYALTLRIYQNPMEHMHKNEEGVLEFNPGDNGYFYLRNKQGGELSTVGLSVSHNGKYLAAGISDYGIAVIGIESGSMRLVDNRLRMSSVYPVPSPSLSVNATGLIVSIGGMNLETKIYQVSADCGLLSDDSLDTDAISNLSTCPARNISATTWDIGKKNSRNGYAEIQQMTFDDTGGTFYYTDNIEWYRINAPNYIPPSNMDYLALGDSYSSGEGDIDYNYGHSSHYLPLTNALGSYTLGIPRELCHLSDRSYPFLLARDMDTTRGENMQSVACSGAVRKDILSQPLIDSGFKNNPLYLGQSTNVTNFSAQPRLFGLANAEQLKSEARANFIPGRVQQAEFVKAKKPKVVTVGISGNDMGFGKVLTNCIVHLVGNECYYASPKGLRDLGVIIEANYDSQLQFYKELKQASPGTDFYAVGYPQFMSDDELLCWAAPSLTTAARTMIRNAVSFANETIKRAAFAAGFKYIDIENVLTGSGTLCVGSRKVSAPTKKVLYGIVTGNYFNFEDQYIIDSDNTIEDYILKNTHASYREAHEALRNNPITAVALFMQETFHPNARAHQAIYDYIHTHQNGTSLLDDTCDGVVILCSDGNVAAPDIPSYFYPAVKVNEIKHSNFMGRFGDVVGDYAAAGDFLTVARDETVQIDAVGAANASSAMMLHDATGEARLYVYENNTKRLLATFSSSSGVSFTMPSDISVGSQVFALEVGNTTYLQPVFITGHTNDIDGDGILNEQDSCEFLTPKGTDIDGDGIDDNCDLKTNATNATGDTIKVGNEVGGVRFADYDSQGGGMSFSIYQRNTSNVDEDPLVFRPELESASGSQKDMDSGMYIGVRYAILVLCFTLIAAPIAIVGGRKFKKGAYNSK